MQREEALEALEALANQYSDMARLYLQMGDQTNTERYIHATEALTQTYGMAVQDYIRSFR